MNAAAQAPATLPELKPGEHYVGLTLHDNTPHHLILLGGEVALNWTAAGKWAKEQGGELPSRLDLLVCHQRAPQLFQREYYWSNEQPADDPASAWFQSFDWGGQGYWPVDDEFRVRAVRRVPI